MSRVTVLLAFTAILWLLVSACQDEDEILLPVPTRGPHTIRVPADHPTIQAAIDAASDGDTVLVAEGVYEGPGNRDIEFKGLSLLLRSEAGPASTIVDVGGEPVGVHVLQPDSAVVIDGFTIRNAQTAMVVEAPSAVVHCIFMNNGSIRAPSGPKDGGLFVTASATIAGCEFNGNAGRVGAGITITAGEPTISECTFGDNAALVSGGGVFCVGGSSPELRSCTFSGNVAATGGAVAASTSSPTIDDCTFVANTASQSGGALHSVESFVSVSNSTFLRNSAGSGGGVYLEVASEQASLAQINNVFIANSASLRGGAVAVVSAATPGLATMSSTDCTFYKNAATLGGGLALEGVSSAAVLHRCIIAFSLEGGAVTCSEGATVTLSCSDVFANAQGPGCLATALAADGNFTADPLFCDPERDDLTLQAISPCAPEHTGTCGPIGALPVGCEGTVDAGDVIQLEGSAEWLTNSISWIHASNAGEVPESEFAFIAESVQAPPEETSHFLFNAPLVLSGCHDTECFPGRGNGWGDADLMIRHLSWSAVEPKVAFEADYRATPPNPAGSWILVMDPRGSMEPVRLVSGQMPTFDRSGSRIVYVDDGRSTILWVDPDGGGGEFIGGLSNTAHPTLSPGDSLLAFSAADLVGRGQRIFVWDTRQPATFPQPVSDPDEPTRDGIDDNHATWSPNAHYVAYGSTVVTGNELKPAIFISRIGLRTGPGAITRVFAFEPGQQLSYLRWHPGGRLLLFILDANAYVAVLPARFWDR